MRRTRQPEGPRRSSASDFLTNRAAPSVREAAAISVGAQVTVMGLMALAQVIAARLLGPVDYGLYGVMVGGITVNAALVNSGVVASLGKYIAEFDAEEDDEGISAAFALALRFEAVLLLATAVVLAALAPLLIDVLFHGAVVPYIVLLVGTAAFGSYAVFQGVLLGLREMRLIAISTVAQGVAAVVLMAALLYVFDLGVGGAAVAYGASLLVLVAVVAAGVGLVRGARFQPTRRRLPGFVSFSAVVTGNAFYDALTAMALAPVVALLIAENQRELVGYTALLASLGLAANNLLLAGYRAAYPYMARWYAMGQGHNVTRLFVYALAATVVLYAGGLLVGSFWGEQLLAVVYGEKFRAAGSHVEIAALAMGLMSLRRLVAFVLYSAGRQNQVLGANIVGIVVFLGCLFALALPLDVGPIDTVFIAAAASNGAALAVVAALFVGNGVLGTDPRTGQPPLAALDGGTAGQE